MVQYCNTLNVLSATATLALLTVHSPVEALPSYPALLPNGNLLGQWLGHNSNTSTAEYTMFAQDFAGQQATWTKELCERTFPGSDMTNGEALGDPCCQWKDANSPVQEIEFFATVPVTRTSCPSDGDETPAETVAPTEPPAPDTTETPAHSGCKRRRK